MNLLTSYTVLNDVTGGKAVSFTYNEIDDKGTLIKDNIKESYIVIDEETKDIIRKLENKINEKLKTENINN